MAEEEEKKKKPNQPFVVNQLPTQVMTSGKVGDEEVDFVTIEESLTEILRSVKKIEKSVA